LNGTGVAFQFTKDPIQSVYESRKVNRAANKELASRAFEEQTVKGKENKIKLQEIMSSTPTK